MPGLYTGRTVPKGYMAVPSPESDSVFPFTRTELHITRQSPVWSIKHKA